MTVEKPLFFTHAWTVSRI